MRTIGKAVFLCLALSTAPQTVLAADAVLEENAMIKKPDHVDDEDKWTVMIDPGHQGSWVDMSAPEPMAPGSAETKPKATTGTQGNFSGVPEYEVNLEVSLVLREELESRGYRVVMTREDSDTAISNKERAELATAEEADITVRIHGNGLNDSSVSGALTMSPSYENPYLDWDICENSNILSQCIIDSYCEATGLENDGVVETDTMTGINWSTVPVTILEMGYMSNEGDDLYITDEANHQTMAEGIADGIDDYFDYLTGYTDDGAEDGKEEVEEEIKETVLAPDMDELKLVLEEKYFQSLGASGEKWAVAVTDLTSDEKCEINGDAVMQSASVIKVFIMGAVYERGIYAADLGLTPISVGDVSGLLHSMITVSDNEAANELVIRLGQGNFYAGAAVVNDFCQDHGYTASHMGRPFLAENPSDDNYTSANDCTDILTDIYNGDLVNEEASAQMLNLLKQQTRKGKIPAGIPQNVATANKTGEMSAGYGLGVIENDMAIVLNGEKAYVISVLSNNIGSNGSAQSTIAGISSAVYQYLSTAQRAETEKKEGSIWAN